jgi:hypothetical protein
MIPSPAPQATVNASPGSSSPTSRLHSDSHSGAMARPARSGHRRFSAADQVALELGERSEDVEHELAAGGGGVDRLLQAAEPDTPVGERGGRVLSTVSMTSTPRLARRRAIWTVLSVELSETTMMRSTGRDCRSTDSSAIPSCASSLCAGMSIRSPDQRGVRRASTPTSALGT